MKLLFSLILCTAILFSCKKFVEIPLPDSELQSSLVFSNEASAQSAMAGLYNQMLTTLGLANGGLTVYPGLSADELFYTGTLADYDQFFTNNIVAANNSGYNSRLWSFPYRCIYHANSIIEGLASSHGITDSTKRQLTGEAKFIRAFHYFYLVNTFGDVPLALSTDYILNATMPRTDSGLIYKQIIADLLDAEILLPTNYPSSGRVRPNKLAATALLARVYLYRGDWQNSEARATTIINSGNYSLLSNLNNAFLASSNEAIWQIMPISTTSNTNEGSNLLPSSTTVKPTFALTSSILAAFETGDLRKSAWIKSNTVSGQSYAYPYKYKVRTGGPPYTEHYMVLRLAEQYLIRAEARAQQSNISGGKADLDIIRNRAGLSPSTITDKNSLLAALQRERRIELFAEWGHRWFDLKRWNIIDAILKPVKPGWDATDALYPIPDMDIQRNPFLKQNPGY